MVVMAGSVVQAVTQALWATVAQGVLAVRVDSVTLGPVANRAPTVVAVEPAVMAETVALCQVMPVRVDLVARAETVVLVPSVLMPAS
jgi:hypothetical protein